MNSVRDDHSGRPLNPPSYFEATTSGPRPDPISPERIEPFPAQNTLEQLLRSLPLQMRRARQDQVNHQKDDEHLLVEHLIPYIAEFFHNLPASVLYLQNHQRPLSAELILLPANAAPATQGWALSGLDQRREDAALVQVVEVTSPGKEKLDCLDQKPSDTLYETLGGDGKDLLWWRNEDLAGRLASTIRCYLEPERNAGSVLRSAYGANGLYEKQEGGFVRRNGFTSRDKSHASTGHKALGSQSRSGTQNGNRNDDSGVIKATVQTEEVTFRCENDMGLWESSSGWVIVVTVTVTS